MKYGEVKYRVANSGKIAGYWLNVDRYINNDICLSLKAFEINDEEIVNADSGNFILVAQAYKSYPYLYEENFLL